MAALLEGLRALGSGRVLDEVLALVLDSAIEVTGAERGFIMLANRERAARVQARARARQGDAVGPDVRDQPEDSRERSSPPASRRSSRTCSTATSRSCTPAPSRSASVTCSARRCAWCATSSAPSRGRGREIIGVLYLDSRERGALRSAAARAALDTLSRRSGAGDRERAAVSRGARQGEVRAGTEGRRGHSAVAAAGREPRRARSSRPPAPRSPCRAVGGDFFDYVDLPTGRFGFIVGDVAGKGLAGGAAGGGAARHVQRRGDLPGQRGAACSTRLNHGMFRRGDRSAVRHDASTRCSAPTGR